MQRNMEERFNQGHQVERKKEGEVTIDYVPPKPNREGDSDGEYVDYEEVK